MVPVVLLLAVVAVVPISMANVPMEVVVVSKCLNGTDCLNYECCVLDVKVGNGVCKPMGFTSDDCYTSQPYAWERPNEMITDFDRCPCMTGEFCVSIGREELGICSFG